MKWATSLAFLGMIAFPTAGMADTTTLVCNLSNRVGTAEDEPTTIELNEAQSSVVVHFGQNHYTVPNYQTERAVSVGPVPAVFGANTISFSLPYPVYGDPYVLNRLTGFLSNTTSAGNFTCHAVQKQF